MNRKIAVLLLGSVLAVTGAVIKGTENANANLASTNINNSNISISEKSNNLDIFAQYGGSPWGQVVNSKTYTNPDTGQRLCFYSSGRWAPCPGQGDVIIIPQNARCRGSVTTEDMLMSDCPLARCTVNTSNMNRVVAEITGGEYNEPPCTGLP